jgi:thiamine biosynthesis lipoprotein
VIGMDRRNHWLHHVEHVMGMAISIDVRDQVTSCVPLSAVVSWLHHVDDVFSTYKDDSAISAVGRGDIAPQDTDLEVREILELCDTVRLDTQGAYNAFAVPAPNGTNFDPSGLVKGWSIERATAMLESFGYENFCINAGGDIAVRGRPTVGSAWRVGVRHPEQPEHLAFVLDVVGPLAVATSATYERGAHILDPRTGQPTTEVASATVVGPDLALADAYATALFVMGVEGLDWLADQPDYEGAIVNHDNATFSTTEFAKLCV